MKEAFSQLIDQISSGQMTKEEALEAFEDMSFSKLEYATIDHHREQRVGYPEVIYCQHKTLDQVVGIFETLADRGKNVLATRATEEMAKAILERFPEAHYNPLGRTVVLDQEHKVETEDYIAIVAAGTSDLPVVEEAYETAKIFGNQVLKIVDVGVAGIHRLFNRLEEIRGAKVIIVVAGMEGALASVLGGLVDKPIIAVPTSVGYGASFGGVSALLTMLNSCASGVVVVNIDNGFGAAYSASQMNQLK